MDDSAEVAILTRFWNSFGTTLTVDCFLLSLSIQPLYTRYCGALWDRMSTLSNAHSFLDTTTNCILGGI